MPSPGTSGARRPAAVPRAFAYEHTDIPPGVTLRAYRRDRAQRRRWEIAERSARRRQAVIRQLARPIQVLAHARPTRPLQETRR